MDGKISLFDKTLMGGRSGGEGKLNRPLCPQSVSTEVERLALGVINNLLLLSLRSQDFELSRRGPGVP